MTVHVGLNGLADWSAAQPFINVLKCGRPWQGRSPTQHTSHSEAVMRSGGHLDADGNPIRIPPGADRVGTIILTEINAADTTLNGRHRLTWTGQGTLHLHGVSNIQRGNGFAEFDYRATGTNLVAIELTAIDAANPLKLVACVRTDHIARHAAGEMFRPAWLDQVRGFPLFRFMDWQATNNSTQRVWADRMRASSYSYVPGAPVEVMVALCNLVGADPWFCYPHLATDDYITRFAQYVRTNLRADLTAHYEFSNEVWNWQFEQAQWANRQGQALWPGQGDAWVQYYAGRSTEMADLLDAVYAGTNGRHRKVLSTQAGYRGLETGILNAPQWVAGRAGRRAPKDAHDCYAITGYFDTGKHGQEGSVEIQQWRQLGETAAFQRMADACDASITRLIETWRYHKRAADAAGLDLVMYEGGSHIVPDHGVLNQNPGLLEFIEKFHYSAHMGRLYTRAISAFQLAGGEAFNVFVEMARSGIHGFWGGLRHAADSNPRWDAVKAALESPAVTPANPSPVEPTPVPTPTPTPEPVPMPTPSPRRAPSTASMLHCLNGHSLTDVIVNSGLEGWPGNLPNLFISQFGEPAWNYPDTFFKDTIPGSPLRVRWNDNSTGRTGIAKFDTLVTTETVPPAKVTAKSNEAPMKDTLDYLVRFAENTIARGKSRKEVIMWAGWPHKDGSPAFGNFRQAAVEYGRSFRFFSEYATWKARRKNPNLPADWRIWTFNTNAWWIRFFDDIQARAVPGITDHRALFRDDIHLTPVGEYALSVFFYTCLYQKDVRTLSYKPKPDALSAALDEYFKRIAWEVASTEESIGMGGNANAAPTFNPAVHGDPLDPAYVHVGDPTAPVDPPVEPEPEEPPVDPEPEPEQPPAEPEPEPEEPNMADRDKLNELLAILKTTTASLETYLADNPVVVTPPVEEPEPEPNPEPEPEPQPEPQPEPAPSMMLPSFRYVQDFNIDRAGRQDWNDPNMHIYLPTWAGGDTGNGVGGSVGTPSMIDYNEDKSVTINAGMVDGNWRNGAMQVNRPQAPAGKWGAVVTSHTASAVNAFFVYANNGKELDFELVKRNGVIGWAPAVHMPRTGGGRASSDKRQMALGPFVPGVEQRLTVELMSDRCMFWVDGVLFETIRPSDMADGCIWDTTTNAYAMATIERHRSWAGWSADDYAQPSSMSVHGFLLPRMP